MDVELTCSACKSHLTPSQPNSVIREEFWPGSARRKSQYMFDQDLFLFFDLLQKNMPGVSESGLVKTLEMFSEAKGRVSCSHVLCCTLSLVQQFLLWLNTWELFASRKSMLYCLIYYI